MLSVCHVRRHIFSVYLINLQADSDFSFRKSHKLLILVGSMQRDQVLDASFSSFLSEIQFSWGCEIGWPKILLIKTSQKDTWGILILILLNSFVEKPSSVPLSIQVSVIYWCLAEISGIGAQHSKEIELHSEISVISWYYCRKHIDDKKWPISRLGTHAWANRSMLVCHFISSARKKVTRGF